MSKVIRISDDIYQRLQRFAVPFEDTPASIIERVLDFYEAQHGKRGTGAPTPQHTENEDKMLSFGLKSGNWYSLVGIEDIDLGKKTTPRAIELGGEKFSVHNWTELCVQFVEWLFEKGYLKKEKMPVPNHARKYKNFINLKPRHAHGEKDGQWKEVGPFFVDTKYNADAHVKNIRSTLGYLGVRDHNLKILFA